MRRPRRPRSGWLIRGSRLDSRLPSKWKTKECLAPANRLNGSDQVPRSLRFQNTTPWSKLHRCLEDTRVQPLSEKKNLGIWGKHTDPSAGLYAA